MAAHWTDREGVYAKWRFSVVNRNGRRGHVSYGKMRCMHSPLPPDPAATASTSYVPGQLLLHLADVRKGGLVVQKAASTNTSMRPCGDFERV